ncbi:MAG: ABC transporter permease subunit [Holophagaceae bacterium]|nr:ABC transporter permease subunit [Holophagaceae bacterium]
MSAASPKDAVLRRAKRVDRLMAVIISVGGLAIIAAVLGMLFFIGKEAFPLFRGARGSAKQGLQAPAQAALLLDESGKAAVAVSAAEGLRLIRLTDGSALKSVAGSPALPWSWVSRPTAAGELLVLDGAGRLHEGRLKWSKPAGEANPAAWDLEPVWQPALQPAQAPQRILAFRLMEGGGLEGSGVLRVAALTQEGPAWLESVPGTTAAVAWKPLTNLAGQTVQAALWSSDGQQLFIGTATGRLLALDVATGALTAEAAFPEPITALAFALGGNSILAGGERGALQAFQLLRTGDAPQLQRLHVFQPLAGPVRGFMPSLRDKRFLVWSDRDLAVDHLTTEARLFRASAEGLTSASLSTRGDLVTASSASGETRAWTLQATHPEVTFTSLVGKVHYEGYDKPEFVWQSSGGTDDFEPKFSLVPLVFGTLKGTLYAMLFALPLAVLGALYTSQFATPRLRNAIKPTVEIMAALPSVVLGFLAGLVMAPLFEKLAVSVLVFPAAALVLALLAFPVWMRLPDRFKSLWGTGREVLWAVPLLVAAGLLSLTAAPAFERAFLGGDYRHWLLSAQGITYDQRNSLVVGFAMGFAVIPIIFTLSEDALSSVPKSLTSASLACGASPWQTAWRVVLPTASPGIFSAVMVGLGRAIGETMIVLMATGNTPVLDWSPFNGMRTLAANIAVEIPEAPHHGSLYRVLFLAAFLLFLLTFLLNTLAELVRQRLRKKYESF